MARPCFTSQNKQNVLNVVEPLRAQVKPKRKNTSKQKGYHKSKHLSDKSHYPTQEKMKIDVEVAEKKTDKNIKKQDNTEQNVLNVVEPLRAQVKPKRKITSKQKGYHKSKHLSDKSHYPTQEKMKIDVEVAERKKAKKKNTEKQTQTLLKDGTITKRIYDILKETGVWMTAREVHDYYDNWDSNSISIPTTINEALSRLFKTKLAIRKKNKNTGIYVYKTIN